MAGETKNMGNRAALRNARTFTPGHTYAFGFNLKAKAALVFPQSRRDAGMHARRCDLPGGVVLMRIARSMAASCAVLMLLVRTGRHGC